MGKKSRAKKEKKSDRLKSPSMPREAGQGGTLSTPKRARVLPVVPSSGLSLLIQTVIIAATVVVTYGHTLDVPFYLDDRTSILENPVIRDFRDIHTIWNFAPLRVVGYFTFALNYHWHQLAVQGYHVFNIMIHFLAGFTVLCLVRGLLQTPTVRGGVAMVTEKWLPLLAALIFLLHPLQTQAVTYIVQRLASMAGLFYIGTLACYVRARTVQKAQGRWGWSAAACLLAVLALFTKQNTVTLPLAILLIEALFFPASFKNLFRYLVLAGVGLGLGYSLSVTVFDYAPFSLEAMELLTRETKTISRGDYLATQTKVIWNYIRLYIWPAGLLIDYDFPLAQGFFDWAVMVSLLAHMVLIVLAVRCAKKYPFLAFAVLFYYVAHLVESSVIPIRDVLFEHRTYLPNLGLCVGAGWLLAQLMAKPKFAISGAIFTGFLFIALGTATFMRNAQWHDPVSMWKESAEQSPNRPRPHNNLGQVLYEQGKVEKAYIHYTKALEIAPYSATANYNMGVLFLDKGELDNAVIYFTNAVTIRTKYKKAHNNLGSALQKQGKYQEAIAHYQDALKIDKRFVPAYNNLGNTLQDQGNFDEAIAIYEKAIKIDAQNEQLHNNLGNAYQKQGNPDKAITHYQQALSIKADYAEAHNNLAVLYGKQGEFDLAVKHFSEALRSNPDYVEAYNSFGLLYARKDEYESATRYLKKALALNPDYAVAHSNLGMVFMMQGNPRDAITHFSEALRLNPDLAQARYNLGRAVKMLEKKQ